MAEWTFEHDGLVVRISRDADRSRIEWSGVSDLRSPASFLSPYLDDWSEKLKDTDVTVGLTGLEYMNSATVKPLLDLVKLLDQTERRSARPSAPISGRIKLRSRDQRSSRWGRCRR